MGKHASFICPTCQRICKQKPTAKISGHHIYKRVQRLVKGSNGRDGCDTFGFDEPIGT